MLKKIAGMSGALALAQIVNFIAISYGSKLFGAEEFGKYSYVNSLSLAVSVLFYLKADNVILLDSNDEISKTLYHLNRYSAFLLMSAVFITVIVSLIYHDAESVYLTLAGVVLAYFNSQFIVLGSALIKEDKTSKYGITAVVRPAVMLLGQYIATYTPKFIYPMVIIRLISEAIAAISRKRKSEIRKYEIIKTKEYLLKRKDYFLYGTVASLLNSLSQQIPMLVLPFKYSYESLAFFSLAFALTVAPMGIILSPLRSLFLKQLSSTNRVKKIVYKNIVFLILPSVFIILFFNLFSGWLVSSFWGDEWESTAEYMAWISFWVASGLVSSPSYSYMIYSAKQKTIVNLENIFLAAKLILMFLINVWSINLPDVVFGIILLGVLYNIVLIAISFKALTNENEYS
ncbi:lipopolysaccharide biosynthesis protein [Aeromonas caviae]